MAQTKQIVKKISSREYAQLPKDVLYLPGLSLSSKIVYVHMWDQYRHFISLGNAYFESMQSIADRLTLSRKTVQGAVDELIKLNLVIKSKTRIGSSYNNTYRVAGNLKPEKEPPQEEDSYPFG